MIMLPVKEKDIVESRDFTAKLYNNEPLPGTEQYADRYQSYQEGHLRTKQRIENTFMDRPEPPRKKRGAVEKKGEKEVELTWAQKYMAKMQEGQVT